MPEIFIENLPIEIRALLTTAIAPHITEEDGAIVIQCWDADGWRVFNALRPTLEQCLPSGYRLAILGGEGRRTKAPNHQR
jgi:hypothetical protein